MASRRAIRKRSIRTSRPELRRTTSISHSNGKFIETFRWKLDIMGRRISNEYQQVNLNAIPYMTTLGGQQFAQAWANVYQAMAFASPPATGCSREWSTESSVL
jgi:hypothetical protein